MTVLGGAAPTASGAARRACARVLPAAVAAALMLVAAGCSGQGKPSGLAASPKPAASSRPGPGPLSPAERDWIAGLSRLKTKLGKPFEPDQMTMTRAKMLQLGRVSGGCGRGLGRLGAPSARLERAYTLARKACRSYGKASRCFARAARVSDPSGATFAGSPQDRIQRRSLNCGFAGAGNGDNSLTDARTEAQEVRASAS